MSNNIEKELKRAGLPSLAFYKLPNGDIKFSTTGFSVELFEMVAGMLHQNKQLYDFFDATLESATEWDMP